MAVLGEVSGEVVAVAMIGVVLGASVIPRLPRGPLPVNPAAIMEPTVSSIRRCNCSNSNRRVWLEAVRAHPVLIQAVGSAEGTTIRSPNSSSNSLEVGLTAAVDGPLDSALQLPMSSCNSRTKSPPRLPLRGSDQITPFRKDMMVARMARVSSRVRALTRAVPWLSKSP